MVRAALYRLVQTRAREGLGGGGDLERLRGCIAITPLRGGPAAVQVQQLGCGREGVSGIATACHVCTHCNSLLTSFAHTTSPCRLHTFSRPVEAAERTPHLHKLAGPCTINSKELLVE